MKLEQTTISKTFSVVHKGKTYHIDYTNSNGQALALCNRDYWEVTDEEGNSIGYAFSDTDKKKAGEEAKLVEELIEFCIKHFNDYKPNLREGM